MRQREGEAKVDRNSHLGKALCVVLLAGTASCAQGGLTHRLEPDPAEAVASNAPTEQDNPAGENKCSGECIAGQYTECTCGADDPCGWQTDGYCDNTCGKIVPEGRFDDGQDCCEAQCAAGEYTTCTCRAEDPCRWREDGNCDAHCADILAGEAFDDNADCGRTPLPHALPDGVPPVSPPPEVCDGACDTRQYNDCTCSTDDPCGWTSDGFCDEGCAGMSARIFDDRRDCAHTDEGELTYTVTAVLDNLDINDYEIMANGLTALGYRELQRNRNVSSSELTRYLQDPSINTLYHTGHGTRGQVATATYQVTVTSLTFAARHVIFATCLTLYPDRTVWESVMGPHARTVLGYTMESLDFTDDRVAQNYVDRLGDGHQQIQAWMLAHQGLSSLIDRWAGYVRVDGRVVEYSARSGNNPAAAHRPSYVELGRGGGIFVAGELLQRDEPGTQPYLRALAGADDTAPVAPPRLGLSALNWVRFTAIDAQRRGEAWLRARGELPDNALFDRVVTVQRQGAQDSAPQTVGYIVRYLQQLDGIPLRSNGEEPHLTVFVDQGSVTLLSRRWPEVTVLGDEGRDSLLPIGDAVLLAAEDIRHSFKGPELHLVDAEPVYGAPGPNSDELVPAYLLHTVEGQAIVVHAATGEPLAP